MHLALGLIWHDLHISVGLLIGHSITMMCVQNNPLCSACRKDEETSLHFLVKYSATTMTQHHILWTYTLQLKQPCVRKVSPSNLLHFALASLRVQ